MWFTRIYSSPAWGISTPWWRHQMENFSVLLAICAGNSPVTGEFPVQRPVTRSFDVFFDLRLNKRLSKQSWGCDLIRCRAHYDVTVMHDGCRHTFSKIYNPLRKVYCLRDTFQHGNVRKSKIPDWFIHNRLISYDIPASNHRGHGPMIITTDIYEVPDLESSCCFCQPHCWLAILLPCTLHTLALHHNIDRVMVPMAFYLHVSDELIQHYGWK